MQKHRVKILCLFILKFTKVHLTLGEKIFYMSSNIRINRICQHWEIEFEAKTTVTQFCGDRCAKYNYKTRKKTEKIKVINEQTKAIRQRGLEVIKLKEILTV
jgi:hypothetical protein